MEVELFTTKVQEKITNTWMGLGFRDKSQCQPYCTDMDQCPDQCYQNTPFIECATWGDENLVPALSYNNLDESKKQEGLYYVETDMGVLESMETFLNDTYLYCRMKQWIQGEAAAANVKKHKDANYVLVYNKQLEYAMMTTWGSTKGVNDGANKCQFKEKAFF
ncbi:unnamed protein product, partial [Mesorhabditis belari]|uniref:Uncharacterized protein n=1 Tax=Mesorhabditis belari TaxID=2138241 RepID=A0AAF3EQ29_9BILA